MRFYEGPTKDGLYSPPSSYSRPSPYLLLLTPLSLPLANPRRQRRPPPPLLPPHRLYISISRNTEIIAGEI